MEEISDLRGDAATPTMEGMGRWPRWSLNLPNLRATTRLAHSRPCSLGANLTSDPGNDLLGYCGILGGPVLLLGLEKKSKQRGRLILTLG